MRQKVLITGASRGIGRETAVRFAQSGYDLFLNCRSSIEELQALARQLEREYSVSCMALQGDVASWEDMKRLFSFIPALDILVNNAGISYTGLLSDMTPEDWHRILGADLDSCFYTSKLAIPLMLRKHSGRIINVSSVWGAVGASMEVAYSAAKGGVNAFTKALAKELAPSNIQVNAVACGCIRTEMNRHLSPEDLENLRAEIPADRIGTPEEAAQLILQVAQAPAYMTGQIITIDGGWWC